MPRPFIPSSGVGQLWHGDDPCWGRSHRLVERWGHDRGETHNVSTQPVLFEGVGRRDRRTDKVQPPCVEEWFACECHSFNEHDEVWCGHSR